MNYEALLSLRYYNLSIFSFVSDTMQLYRLCISCAFSFRFLKTTSILLATKKELDGVVFVGLSRKSISGRLYLKEVQLSTQTSFCL